MFIPTQHWFIDGSVPSHTLLNSQLSNFWYFMQHRPVARVSRTTVQSIPHGSGTYTAIAFNSEELDNDTMWSGGQATRLYINTTGYWFLSSQIAFVSNSTNYRRFVLRKNGSTVISARSKEADVHNSSMCMTALAYLYSGDYIEMLISQDSGVALNTATTTHEKPQLAAQWLVQ
jgi:hypothetical protein